MPEDTHRPPWKIAGDIPPLRVWEIVEAKMRLHISCDACGHEAVWTPLYMEKKLRKWKGATLVRAAVERAAVSGPVTVVAEANQGGEMVRQVLVQAGIGCQVKLVHATEGKRARAEPVGLIYEQGRVSHGPGLEPLEDQMLLLGSDEGRGGAHGGESPDRADALVWALTALMLGPCGRPRIVVL